MPGEDVENEQANDQHRAAAVDTVTNAVAWCLVALTPSGNIARNSYSRGAADTALLVGLLDHALGEHQAHLTNYSDTAGDPSV